MAATSRDLIHNTLRWLLGGQREMRNVLAANVDSSQTTLTFTHDLQGIAQGAKVAVDLEDTYVWSKVDTAKTATVDRAQFGTTAAAHTSGTNVYVNPQWSKFDVLQAVNAELAELSGRGLFRMKTVDVTYSPAVQGYDLTGVTDIIDVWKVEADTPGPDNSWPELRQWKFVRNMAVGEFPSTFGLVVYDAPFPGESVRVRYRAGYSPLATLTDDVVAVSGLRVEAHDILEMGAALRLAAARPIRRAEVDAQGGTRRAGESTTVDALQAPGQLKALLEQRIASELRRLHREYPLKVHSG